MTSYKRFPTSYGCGLCLPEDCCPELRNQFNTSHHYEVNTLFKLSYRVLITKRYTNSFKRSDNPANTRQEYKTAENSDYAYAIC